MHPAGLDGAVPSGRSERAILTSNAILTLAEPLDGEREAVDARCETTFDEDPDDRPVLFRLAERRAAVLDTATGELLGTMVWRARPYGDTMGCTAWNIGIKLLPAARGRGLGPTAGRLLIDYLFDTTELGRVEAYTEEANVAGQRGLEKIGFQREGIMRGVHLRGGKQRDLVLYSLLRSDLERTRTILADRDGVALARTRPGNSLDLLDTDTGETLGTAEWRPVTYGPAFAGAWNVTVTLARHALPHAGTVHSLLTEHLFATTTLDRIESVTTPDDLAHRQALERAGFRPDGRIRGVRRHAGRAQDALLYGLLREDLAGARPPDIVPGPRTHP